VTPFKKSSKIRRDDPAGEENKEGLRTSRRSNAQFETLQDPKIATPKLDINTGLLLQNLKTYLNQRGEELKTYLLRRDDK
jgi:hypothetical protein